MRARAAALLFTVALGATGCAGDRPTFTSPDVIYLATPDSIGTEMLRLAGVTAGDVVYDLGSGDGRLVIAAARDFGARAVGVELEPALVQTSRESALKAGVADRSRFLWQDIFATDLHEATVVMLYLGEHVNLRLRPKLLAELRAGTRIVSHKFGMGDWRPDRTLRARGPDGEHGVYLWLAPADVAGRWRVSLPGRTASLTLVQRFQSLSGTLDGVSAPATVSGALAGAGVRLSAGDLVLDGRVEADRMTGRVTSAGAASGDWSAERLR